MDFIHKRVNDRLAQRRDEGAYRDPLVITSRDGRIINAGGRTLINFASNDYLGLASSRELRDAVADAFSRYGSSSSSSRAVSGTFARMIEAERAYAEFFGYESCLFTQSGYQGNIALISALFEKGDIILCDKKIHASLAKGIALSGASFHGYNHNDLSHCEKRLRSAEHSPSALVAESLFSMDGDIPDFDTLASLKKKYGFCTIIDEAHAFGVLGNQGRGIACGTADIATGTFGKAFGLFGAFVLMPKAIREYMINFSSPVIYSTALPEAHAVCALRALELVAKNDDARAVCLEHADLLRNILSEYGIIATGNAQIVIIHIGSERDASRIASRLAENGIFLPAIRYPTVPRGKAILRASVTALHTKDDIHLLAGKIREYIS
jgi:8-amino-7-oxononanoate synthase